MVLRWSQPGSELPCFNAKHLFPTNLLPGKSYLAGFEAAACEEVWRSTGSLLVAAQSVTVENEVNLLQTI